MSTNTDTVLKYLQVRSADNVFAFDVEAVTGLTCKQIAAAVVGLRKLGYTVWKNSRLTVYGDKEVTYRYDATR